MSLSSEYRWILVGKINIRNRKNSPEFAPNFDLNDLHDAIDVRIKNGDGHRIFASNQSRMMWCENLKDQGEYYKLLVNIVDKNIPGVSFHDFQTRISRDIKKNASEGGHYASHVIIKKCPDDFGQFLVLLEKVPGIFLASVKAHFSWLCKQPESEKFVQVSNNQRRKFIPIIDIVGCPSKTIGKALQNGTLQDIELISHEKVHDDGLDEEAIVKESVNELRLNVKRKVGRHEMNRLFSEFMRFYNQFSGKSDKTKIYIRIKTPENQTKRTEIRNVENFLEEAFVQNEMVENFDRPLTQRYENLRTDMIEKMVAIADNLTD